MHAKQNTLTQPKGSDFFTYGILQLSAHATVTRIEKSPTIMRYLSLKFIQWANSIFVIIKPLWTRNNITLSDFMWMEPSDFMHQIILQKRMQKRMQKEADKQYKEGS